MLYGSSDGLAVVVLVGGAVVLTVGHRLSDRAGPPAMGQTIPAIGVPPHRRRRVGLAARRELVTA